MKLRGTTLYKEGSKPNGIWLVSSGAVKWASKIIRSKQALHPTFTHGSTLGLYEVLIGKPYICDIITDSVVVCFFLEADKILSVFKSNPIVEGFLWQESCIVLMKLLLPQVFEKMAMQDLRVLIAERSTMTTYIRGETVEVPSHSIGFLLEGFVKSHGLHQELITSPAALWPQKRDLSLPGIEGSGTRSASFSHQGLLYYVETRARVIIFDIAAFEADNALQRRPSSLMLHAVDHPTRSVSGEHGGLMSWPEHYYKPGQHHQEEMDEPINNLSAKALQLSIFGSMVPNTQWHGRSFYRSSSQVKPSHSMSYPRVPSGQGPRLVSVRSEGSAGNRIQEELTIQDPRPSSHSKKQSRVPDDSSDDSGVEDDVIVRIDSPSRLFSHQAS
ncbi:hypothetical protein Nepgr_008571 [Nepenthes gracilis]|uniref:Cyclic nucleotide-binding domain-containing protein n=1 Tax=Nepenthes gracilis TaxID=150966 RepID=A0AAD3S9A4_NEPGR|nr:hypothetical protein Nepgr_008571 [Nepenthes gracilis]